MQQLPFRCATAATGTYSHAAASEYVAINSAIDAKSMVAGPRRPRRITPGTPCHGSRPGAAEKRSFSCPGAAKRSLVNKAPRTPRFILVHTSHGPERRLARSVRQDWSRSCEAAQGIWRRAATDCKAAIVNINNCCKQRELQNLLQLIRPRSSIASAWQQHRSTAARAALRIDAAARLRRSLRQ